MPLPQIRTRARYLHHPVGDGVPDVPQIRTTPDISHHPVGDGVLDVPLYVPHPGTPVSVGEGLAPPAVPAPPHGFASVGADAPAARFSNLHSCLRAAEGGRPYDGNERPRIHPVGEGLAPPAVHAPRLIFASSRRGRRPRRPVSPTFIHVCGRPRAAVPYGADPRLRAADYPGHASGITGG